MREPAVIAELDQEGAKLQSAAEMLGTFFRALVDEGFSPPQAMDLVRDYFACYEGMDFDD